MLLPLFVVFLYTIAAYLIGSIPFGLLLSKIFGYGDIRKIGSGNIGATNVLRTGNKKLAFITLLLDASKAAVFLLFLQMESTPHSSGAYDPTIHVILLLLGFVAILGHCYPVWLKFKGGKGVATALGVLLAAVPMAGLVAVTTWGIVAGFFRYSSLAALSALAITPLATFLIYGGAPALITLLIAALVFWRHKDNIKRLMKGEEPKIRQKKKDSNHQEH
ncbi:MAG: glycerol-3-phosphate 1-O-acyltransferase PlsY [Alphaproteobacteria bacterium]|nr:glycerol-3-phosphate 1-O-acyltransferase PlsY [Alphaproteobacteria bacterium]